LEKRNVDIEEFKRLHAEGMTNKEIANNLDFSHDTARKISCDLGLATLAKGRKPGISAVIDNDELKKLYATGLTDKEIGYVFGVNEKTIFNNRRSLGLSKWIKWKNTAYNIEKFKQLHAESLNDKKIANVLGISRDTARKIRHYLGLPPQKLDRKHIDIVELKRLFAEGLTDEEIGTIFGVSAYTVYERRREIGLFRRKRQIRFENINMDEFKRLYAEGMSDKKICEALGVQHQEFVAETRRQLGLAPNHGRFHEKKRELYDVGMSDGQIAKIIGGGKRSIAAWRRNHGLPPNKSDDALDVLEAELLKLYEDDPIQQDSESLFCDNEFLESFVGKAIEETIVSVYIFEKTNVDELKKLFVEGLSDVEIGKLFGVCDKTISNRRRSLGLFRQKPKQIKRKDIDIDELKQLYCAGMSDVEISKAIAISQSVVFRIRHELGLAPNRGRRHFEMRELYDLGLSDGKIAEILKVRRYSVTTWRQNHGLPSNDPDDASTDAFKLSKPEEEMLIQRDSESLFCDTEFLENYLGKDITGKL